MIDPRVIINYVSLVPETPIGEGLEIIAQSGVSGFGLPRGVIDAAGVDTVAEAAQRHGLNVVYVIHRCMFRLDEPDAIAEDLDQVRRSLDLAARLGAGFVYGTTGPGGSLEPEAAADRFVDAVRPAVEHAESLGIGLNVETTNPQFADIDIVHTLRDSAHLVERSGVGLVVDAHSTWTEPGLLPLLDRVAPTAAMLQVSDYIPGTRTVSRDVPGDGIIPLRRILGRMLAAGFRGPIDLELFGHGRGDGSDAAELRRGAEYVTRLLSDIEQEAKGGADD